MTALASARDAEVYLRRLGERMLGASLPESDPAQVLWSAAAALVFVGAIGSEPAWRVLDDYATARHLRSGQAGFVHAAPPPGRRAAPALRARHFRAIDQQIVVAGVRVLVRDLAITAEGGALRYRRYLEAPGLGEGSRMLTRPRLPWTATPPDIVDSEGNRPAVFLGDGGRDGQGFADAELALRGTIAPEAAWLELDGTRVNLHGDPARWEVSVAALGEPAPLERFFGRYLAVVRPQSGATRDVEPMIQALLAVGALDAGSTLVADVRAIAARMPRRPLHQRRIVRAPASGLDEPWGSLLDREGADDGPQWMRVLGAVAPVCDGVQFAVNAMRSDRDGFEIDLEVAPHVIGLGALDELPVAWWARDDLGQHYLGVPTVWGGCSDDRSEGTMRYWPALDPAATRLELMMCTESHRATVSVALPGREDRSR